MEERVVERFVQINFNKAIIERFKSYRITADIIGTVYFILFALFEEKYELLDVLDDDNKERRTQVLYHQLVLRELLQKTVANDEVFYRLTPKGNELVTFIREQAPKVHAENFVSMAETELCSVDQWILDYVNLFPIQNGEGRSLRIHEMVAEGKMKPFIRKYKYAKDVILAATREYLQEQEKADPTHKYTKNASNFIQKYGTGESELAAWCKRVIDMANEPREEKFDSSIFEMI